MWPGETFHHFNVMTRPHDVIFPSQNDHGARGGDLLPSLEKGHRQLPGEDRKRVHPGLHEVCHPVAEVVTRPPQSPTGAKGEKKRRFFFS